MDEVQYFFLKILSSKLFSKNSSFVSKSSSFVSLLFSVFGTVIRFWNFSGEPLSVLFPTRTLFTILALYSRSIVCRLPSSPLVCIWVVLVRFYSNPRTCSPQHPDRRLLRIFPVFCSSSVIWEHSNLNLAHFQSSQSRNQNRHPRTPTRTARLVVVCQA